MAAERTPRISHNRRMLALILACHMLAAVTSGQDPTVSTNDRGDLLLNVSATGAVLFNGVDLLGTVQNTYLVLDPLPSTITQLQEIEASLSGSIQRIQALNDELYTNVTQQASALHPLLHNVDVQQQLAGDLLDELTAKQSCVVAPKPLAIATSSAMRFKSFSIETRTFLMVINSQNISDTSGLTLSTIYVWNATTEAFDSFQNISTLRAYDVDFIQTQEHEHLLVIAEADLTSDDLGSAIYRFSALENEFKLIQWLSDAHRSVELFIFADKVTLALGKSDMVQLFQYDRAQSKFISLHELAITGAPSDIASFGTGRDIYLTIAIESRADGSSAQSLVLKYGQTSATIVSRITTYGCQQIQPFYFNNTWYLVTAEANSGSSYQIPSRLFSFQNEQFQYVQNIATTGASGAEVFSKDDVTYVFMTNYQNASTFSLPSQLLKLDEANGRLVQIQTVPTIAAERAHFFSIGSLSFVAIPSALNSSGLAPTTSYVYKWCNDKLSL